MPEPRTIDDLTTEELRGRGGPGKARRRTPLRERFAQKFVRGSPNDCWEWMGWRDRNGYGSITEGGGGSLSGRRLRSNRAAWEIANGPIPDGLHVLHSCDNPPCVNPRHLFLGTARDNIHDMLKKGRGAHPEQMARVGEDNGRAVLSEAKVLELRLLAGKGRLNAGRAARRLGVAPVTIIAAVRGDTWRHLPMREDELLSAYAERAK